MRLDPEDYITALRARLRDADWESDEEFFDKVRAELAKADDDELCRLYHCAIHPYAIGETAITMDPKEDLVEALGCTAFHFGVEIGQDLAYLETTKGMVAGNA